MNRVRRTIGMLIATIMITLGGAVAIAPAANAYTWTNCFVAMNGRYYCYKQCTYEEWRNGCDNGWYYWDTWYA